MKYSEIQTTLQNITGSNISVSSIANILGVTRQNMSFRIKEGKKDIPQHEIELLEKHFNVVLLENTLEIEHIHINPSCGKGTIVLEDPDVTPIRIGKEIIQSVWGISNPKDLKIFKASGDSMSPIIEDGNLLLVNTARTDFNNGGIYLLTINNDWFVKRIRKRLTGELDIISDNAHYPIETFNKNSFSDVSIIGRVIKNLSKGL